MKSEKQKITQRTLRFAEEKKARTESRIFNTEFTKMGAQRTQRDEANA
jgi:hypothetical protein